VNKPASSLVFFFLGKALNGIPLPLNG